MKFWEAMKAMEEGKKVRNVNWGEHQYIYLDKNDKSIIDEEEDYFPIRYIDDEEIWEIHEEKYEEKKEAPYALRQLAIDLMQFDSDLNSMVDKEDIGSISTLLVKLNEKYDIY